MIASDTKRAAVLSLSAWWLFAFGCGESPAPLKQGIHSKGDADNLTGGDLGLGHVGDEGDTAAPRDGGGSPMGDQALAGDSTPADQVGGDDDFPGDQTGDQVEPQGDDKPFPPADAEAGDAFGGDALEHGDAAGVPPETHCYFQAAPNAPPRDLHSGESLCIDADVLLTFEGPAHGDWQLISKDGLGLELGSMPQDPPGELIPVYLGGGEYSPSGFAEVAGAAVAPEAAVLTIDIAPTQWTLNNTCSKPLLSLWVFELGLGTEATEKSSGTSVCPSVAPWTVAVGAPLASAYEVAVFDFGNGTADYFDDTTLLQDANGYVAILAPPTDGRFELTLFDNENREVESASLYFSCR